MSQFEPSEHSYGAPPRRRPHKGQRARRSGGAGVIAEDRRRIREIKKKIRIAVRQHQDGHALARELHEAEVKLHFDLARIRGKKGGAKSPSLAEIRQRHRMKTPEQAAQEAEAEEQDTTGTTADANDAAAADSPTADLIDADNDVDAPASGGSSGTTILVVLGSIALAGLTLKVMTTKKAAA